MHSSFVPFPNIFINKLYRTRPFTMPVLHYHDGYEIFYINDGSRNFFINDIEYRLNRGSVLLVKPFEMHFSFSCENPAHERYVINFKREHLESFLTDREFKEIDILFEKRILKLGIDMQKYIATLLDIMDADNKENSDFVKKAVVSELIHLCHLLQKEPADKNDFLELSPIFEAVKYINENFRQDLSLSDLSSLTHLAPAYFCRQFKKITGATFLQYLNNIRVNKAHLVLTTTDKSISTIAEECGFSSVAHMTRIFNKNYGMPPSKFDRKKL